MRRLLEISARPFIRKALDLRCEEELAGSGGRGTPRRESKIIDLPDHLRVPEILPPLPPPLPPKKCPAALRLDPFIVSELCSGGGVKDIETFPIWKQKAISPPSLEDSSHSQVPPSICIPCTRILRPSPDAFPLPLQLLAKKPSPDAGFF